MKIRAQKDLSHIQKIILDYFSDYNIVYNAKVNEDTRFMIIEKYYMRTSSRASLSLVLFREFEDSTIIHAVGAGGGTGWLFKFDWGTKESFETIIKRILDQHHISYNETYYES